MFQTRTVEVPDADPLGPAFRWRRPYRLHTRCASGGIDPGDGSISYLTGWSEHTPISTIERTACLIDRLA
jgi:hypothetical protein